MNDTAPKLLENIKTDFKDGVLSNSEIEKCLSQLNSTEVQFDSAYTFASEIGQELSKAYGLNIKLETLPDGKMYFNIADRVITPTLKDAHKLISEFAADVEKILNEKAGLKLNPVKIPPNEDRIKGIVEKVVSYDDYEDGKWVLDEPVKTFCKSIVDETIKANANFHHDVGLTPKVIRKSNGHCCDWCSNLVGEYEYPDVPEDVWRRHGHCDCTVEYLPGDGRSQDVWSKKWVDIDREEEIEQRKVISETTKDKVKEALKRKVVAFDLKSANHTDLIQLGKEINDAYNIRNHIGDKEALKQIFSEFREMGGMVPADAWTDKSVKGMKNILQDTFSYYPKDWADLPKKEGKQIHAIKTKRGFFNTGAVNGRNKYITSYPNYRTDYFTIAIDGIKQSTPFHEIGHMIEESNPDILRINKEWVESRTQGEREVGLNKIFRGWGYGKNEVTKKDDFISPYIGKTYDDATEVLSMGLENIFEPNEKGEIKQYNSPTDIVYAKIEDDEEFMNLIIGHIVKG